MVLSVIKMNTHMSTVCGRSDLQPFSGCYADCQWRLRHGLHVAEANHRRQSPTLGALLHELPYRNESDSAGIVITGLRYVVDDRLTPARASPSIAWARRAECQADQQ